MSLNRTAAAVNKNAREPSHAAPVHIRQKREKASRFAILGMLTFGKKKSGYDLKKAIAASTANFWSESYGNIYPTLRKLLEEGAIQEENDKTAATKRPKQLYSITEKGRESLKQWFRRPVPERSEDNELLLKLFFGAMMSPEESLVLLKAHRDHHIALLERFEGIERRIMTGPSTDEQRVYLRATLSYGQAVSQALMQWSDATEKALRTLES